MGGYLITGDFNEALKYGWEGIMDYYLAPFRVVFNGIKAARANGTDIWTGTKNVATEITRNSSR